MNTPPNMFQTIEQYRQVMRRPLVNVVTPDNTDIESLYDSDDESDVPTELYVPNIFPDGRFLWMFICAYRHDQTAPLLHVYINTLNEFGLHEDVMAENNVRSGPNVNHVLATTMVTRLNRRLVFSRAANLQNRLYNGQTFHPSVWHTFMHCHMCINHRNNESLLCFWCLELHFTNFVRNRSGV